MTNKKWRWVVVVLTLIGIVMAVNQIFLLRLGGFTIIDNGYLYALAGIFLSCIFVLRPGKKGATSPAWYDVALFLISLATCTAFAFKSLDIIAKSWAFQAPIWAAVASVVLWALAIEAARRTAGMAFTGFVLVVSLYPMFAIYVPGVLQGQSFPPITVVTYHAMSNDSMMGMVMRVFGSMLIGFMLFSSVLEGTGAGKFFIDMAYAILGTKRGGPAKVDVVASGLFGMINGSAVANVATMGAITIPAMKKAGFKAETAAAVEACTSVGGALMPPVMGAIAFIMAGIMGIPYSTVVIVAIVPCVLWFVSLFCHVDGEAARAGVKGLPKDQLPSAVKTLAWGWSYLVVFAALVVLMFWVVSETQAPFLAGALGLFLAMFRKETRVTREKAFNMVYATGKVLSGLVGVLLPVGLVLGSLTVTGMAQSVTGELIRLAGHNLYLILIMTFFASFVLGLGLTASIVYIMLMVVVAPSLIGLGLNPLGVNFFLLYAGVLGDLTPPTAIAVFAAASIAGAPPMKAAMASMKMSAVLYVIPFAFVLNPALVLQGPVKDIIFAIPTSIFGVAVVACGIVGFMWGPGRLALPTRLIIVPLGFMQMLPGIVPWRIAGVAVAIVVLFLNWRFVKDKGFQTVERSQAVEEPVDVSKAAEKVKELAEREGF